MNAPLPKNMTPIRLAEVDIPFKRDEHAATNLTPLEADILREEIEARERRTASPLEVFETLRQSEHRTQNVTQQAFSVWLLDRDWPEEQAQKVTQGGNTWIMKLFKGPDGFAVKWVPIVAGQIQAHRAVYDILWFTGKRP